MEAVVEDEFMSQDEVDALLTGVDEADAPATPQTETDLQRYDFAAQSHLISERLPALERIQEQFLRVFREAMHGLMRRNVELSISPPRVVRYSEFCNGLGASSSLHRVQFAPLAGDGLVAIDAGLANVLVDHLFGSDGRFHKTTDPRPMTQAERRIAARLLAHYLDAWQQAWQPVLDIKVQRLRDETDIVQANLANPDDLMLTSTLLIKLGTLGGDIQLAFPYTTFEPIRPLLRAELKAPTLTPDLGWTRQLSQQVQAAEIELCADLGHSQVTLRQILAMQTGDFIPIEVPPTVEARADGTAVLECQFGLSNNQYALRVERVLSPDPESTVTGVTP